MSDTQIKKQLVREIRDDFDAIMASYPSIDQLVHDLTHVRIGTDPASIGQTIIFANSRDEADEIVEIINAQYGQEVAISYHSSNDEKMLVEQTGKKHTGLERFRDESDPIKIIVAIGKLNESVDVPTVENVVFWRGTDVAKIFLQQFGRGLRGDGMVNYYDYV